MSLSPLAFSCSDFNLNIPKGPDGDDGQTSYYLWKSEVESGNITWPADRTEISDFIAYKKGDKGDAGDSAYELWKQLISSGDVPDPHDPSRKWDPAMNSETDFWNYLTGRDGQTPHIGDDGNWWIGDENTGVAAIGKNGKDGKNGLDGLDGEDAYSLWKKLVNDEVVDWPKDQTTVTDFYTYLKGKDGENGVVPHVGTNGNWYIGGTDTGVPAKGAKGDTGDAGADGTVPHIGDNGNWYIGTTDTGIPSKGDQGDAGSDGADGTIPHVGDNGNWYIGTTDTGIAAKGDQGDTGAAGEDALSPTIGSDGNWYIGTTNTGIPAKGMKGDKGDNGDNGADGALPVIIDGIWWIGSTNTGIAAKGATGDKGATGADGKDGADGKIPYIQDGNWYISGTDTGIAAKGDQGDTGADGSDGADGIVPHIGDNGNWYIGTTDTGIAAAGKDGAAGKSAYELWVEDVKADKITDKSGAAWPKDKITIEDFYRFLKGEDGADGADGADGKNGRTAYETWKEQAEKGTLDDPKNPGQKWPASNVTEADFYYYLSGEDGTDGIASSVNGKSAWELWKEELAARAGTSDPLWNYAEDVEWDPTKNSLEDFYLYLRGTDGANGKDGKPGLPGEPGAIVTIVKGQPNVIAQYSQSEFGEYVRTTDGGVLYKVYDKYGALAPGAVVKGLPGLDPTKSYTADENGEFIIPRTELPEIQDIESRWGTVAEVTIKGETLESAKNTYVPNQPHIRMILRPKAYNYTGNYNVIYYNIQRKMNPDDEWSDLISYLPNYLSFTLKAIKVKDRYLPDSTDESLKIYTQSGTDYNSQQPGEKFKTGYKHIYVYRFMKENVADDKNNNSTHGDGTEVFFTVAAKESYYGMPVKWNGVAMLPPHQLAPLPKKLHFTKISSGTQPYFAKCEGEFDFTTFDINKIYSSAAITVCNPEGIEYVNFKTLTLEDAKASKAFYMNFEFNSTAGKQSANNANNKSSYNEPGFTIYTPYYGSAVYSWTSNNYYGKRFQLGQLLRDTSGNYYIKPTIEGKKYPNLVITYSEE